jgi:chitodextrinase
MTQHRPVRSVARRCARPRGWVLVLLLAIVVVVPGAPVSRATEMHSFATMSRIAPSTGMAGSSGLAPQLAAPSPSGGSEPAAGPGLPHWINVTGGPTASHPPASTLGTLAYDPVAHESVYFGGCTGTDCPNALTWVFANATWINVTSPSASPPARYGAAMDYDAHLHGILLFGGVGASLSDLNDTWLYRNGAWSDISGWSAAAPAPRAYASLAFDPQREENGSVLLGGYVGGVGYVNDTWVFESGAGWVSLSPSAAPPSTGRAQMVYDPADSAVVVFGCGYGCGSPNETWELYSGQWWQVAAAGPVPPYRYDASMSYDSALSKIVMFGGWGFAGALNDTWTFAHGTWTDVTSQVGAAPPGRWVGAMAGNSGAFPPLLFGGTRTFYANGAVADTWVLETPPAVSPLATPSSGETSVPVTLGGTVSGGTAPYSAIVGFGDGSQEGVAVAAGAFQISHAYGASGSYTPWENVTDAAGARAVAGATGAVVVLPGPAAAPRLGPWAGDAGIFIALTGETVVGGAAPYVYSWEFGDGATESGRNATHMYQTAGLYAGNWTVTDALGGTARASFDVAVQGTPTLSVGASALFAGVPGTAYANVTGGTAPFHFSWRFSDGGASASPYARHTFGPAGTYTIEAWANDSAGASAHASATVTVGPAPPAVSSSGSHAAGLPAWFWPAVVGLAVVGALGTAVLVWRGRRRDSA